jgi:nucleoside-diphosphate-sugar epimerase
MTQINPNQLRILITGVSGLVGRVLSNHLRTKYPTKYKVFGVDQHMNISTRYQAVNSDDLSTKKMLPVSVEKFFECDITDRTRLHQIIKEQKIDNIIHLAAALETHPNLQTISRINIEGARNVFEARELSIIMFCFI